MDPTDFFHKGSLTKEHKLWLKGESVSNQGLSAEMVALTQHIAQLAPSFQNETTRQDQPSQIQVPAQAKAPY